jgi:hypothetical protein
MPLSSAFFLRLSQRLRRRLSFSRRYLSVFCAFSLFIGRTFAFRQNMI